MKPMKIKRAFSLLLCFLFLAAGCEKAQRATTQTNEKAAKQFNENNINDFFKTQLIQFLSSASQVNAATEAGVSKQDLDNIYIVAKGQFDLLEDLWPKDFCPEGKTDMQEALKGWSYAKANVAGVAYTLNGFPKNWIITEQKIMYENLSRYEANPFGIQFVRYTNQDVGVAIDMVDNMPRLLSIASKYFERGKHSILTNIEKRSNAP